MTQTNQLTSPNLRPHTADLNRLLAGEHHDPHSVLGAHEYDDHTVIRAYRPHAVEVVALVGGERYPFEHIEGGLFAVALPFTNLVDYRLEVGYSAQATRTTCTPSPTPTGSCRPSARSTCTSSPRAATSGYGRSSAPIPVASPRPTAWSTECLSRCGRRMPRASA